MKFESAQKPENMSSYFAHFSLLLKKRCKRMQSKNYVLIANAILVFAKVRKRLQMYALSIYIFSKLTI